MSRTTRSLILLSLVLAIAAWLRLWRIDAIPPGFHFDEAFEGLEAWRILTEPSYRPIFLTGNFGVPPLNAYANALTFAITQAHGGEAGPTAMRTTAAVFGVLGVLALYALGVELQRLDAAYRQLSRYLPLLAAASLGAMRWHIHFSRMGIEPVLVPLVWSAAIWLLLVAWRTGRWLAYAMAGVVIAAGMYAYQGAWVIPFAHGRRRTPPAGSRLARTSPPPTAMEPPHHRPCRRRPRLRAAGRCPWHGSSANTRTCSYYVPRSSPSSAKPAVRLTAPWAATFGPASKCLRPPAQAGDLDPRRNLPGAPVLNLWQALPFYAGLLVAVVRIRRPAYSIALLGLIGLLLPGVFSEYAPHYHRMLGAAAPVALLCGIGLDWLWQRVAAFGHAQPASQGRRRWQGLAAGCAHRRIARGCGHRLRPRLLCALGRVAGSLLRLRRGTVGPWSGDP